MANIHIYQIYYDENSKAGLDPGFLPLDNSRNERPDWREYHPMRTFLLERKLEDGAYYGFLSPRFGSKTNLTAGDVTAFVQANEGVDVALFCPFFDQSAFFLNVFEQGEFHHPGLMRLGQAFAKSAGFDADLSTLVNDSSNTIFNNYFVARSDFWAEWLRVGEWLYAQAESPAASLSGFRTPMLHRGSYSVELKIFLMERLATLLLSTGAQFKTAAFDPTRLPMADVVRSNFLREAIACDALKRAYGRSGDRKCLDEFLALRNRVVSNLLRK